MYLLSTYVICHLYSQFLSSCHVSQAELELLGSSDPPDLASQVAANTSTHVITLCYNT